MYKLLKVVWILLVCLIPNSYAGDWQTFTMDGVIYNGAGNGNVMLHVDFYPEADNGVYIYVTKDRVDLGIPDLLIDGKYYSGLDKYVYGYKNKNTMRQRKDFYYRLLHAKTLVVVVRNIKVTIPTSNIMNALPPMSAKYI